jgi:hypothetical protein
MSAIIPFSSSAKLPAYMANRAALAAINADVPASGPSYGKLSIKGKVFTLVKGDERKVLTRDDDPDEVLQSLVVTAVRANTKYRAFFAKAYVEGSEGDEASPSCKSADGIAPTADSRDPQSKKCQLCPNAVWGTGKEGKGTACSVSTRLAIVDPEQLAKGGDADPFLLSVPAASRSNFAEVVSAADKRGIPYNALAIKVGFDPMAPSPKLTFKLTGLVDDDSYEKINALYGSELVLNVLGMGPVRATLPAPTSSATDDDLEAALAAKAAKAAKDTAAKAAAEAAVKKAQAAAPASAPAASMDDLDAMMGGTATATPKAPAKAKPKPAPAPVAESPVAAPVAAPAPAPVSVAESAGVVPAGMEDLLNDLDGLLNSSDD